MAKVRVYELAKEFGVESKAVMAKLQEMGEFVRSASSTIEAPVVRRLTEAFAECAAQQAKQAKEPARDAQRGQRPQAASAPGGRQGGQPDGQQPRRAGGQRRRLSLPLRRRSRLRTCQANRPGRVRFRLRYLVSPWVVPMALAAVSGRPAFSAGTARPSPTGSRRDSRPGRSVCPARGRTGRG